ncbi:substrate-binding domain-containing protein [Streptomyces sp. NPDC058659]|uniref:substrate-binding domain-containing protein n=1 Tax=unclassified Streptomyces TaxID=2593676 RepID=UPI003667946D
MRAHHRRPRRLRTTPVPTARHTEPPLTTVRRPMREMGRAAARMLPAGLAGAPIPDEPLVLRMELIVSGSAPKS